MKDARPPFLKWIAPAVVAALAVAGGAKLALDGAGPYDRKAFMDCMHNPPVSGIERERLLRMTFEQIENACDCHAGVCR